ncbi:182 kDa tankyrase-1-binding protein isoform X3 [Sardina pilchardus]|uniref:182 kDa tankyrase-1-binding protein isoform X3 n=1 Tax=Sardina pilchardus TaxID=27697 RepID=UPI002E121B9D
MQYLGDKLTTAQAQVTGWVGNVRRSLQGALDVVSGALQQRGPQGAEEAEEVDDDDAGVGGHGRFQRAVMPLRSFASRSRRSLRSLSLRGRQRLSSRKRPANGDAEKLKSAVDESRVQDTDALIPDSETHDDTQEPDNSHTAERAKSPEIVVPEVTATEDEPEAEPVAEAEAELEAEDEAEDEADMVDNDLPSEPEPEPELPPFPEVTTPLLDSTVQRSRVDLGKRRSTRTRPPKASRQSAAMPTVEEGSAPDWRFCDSADGKMPSSKEESSSEDEQPREKEATPTPSQPHRVALPGMDAASLKARLFGSKRRSGEGTKGVRTDAKVPLSKEEESSSEDEQPREKQATPTPSQPHRVALPVMDAAALKARLFGSKKRSGEAATGGKGGGGGKRRRRRRRRWKRRRRWGQSERRSLPITPRPGCPLPPSTAPCGSKGGREQPLTTVAEGAEVQAAAEPAWSA